MTASPLPCPTLLPGGGDFSLPPTLALGSAVLVVVARCGRQAFKNYDGLGSHPVVREQPPHRLNIVSTWPNFFSRHQKGGKPMSYTDEEKELLLGLINDWQTRLRLSHWVIRVDWDEPSVNEDCGLEVEVVEGRHYAVVRVGGFFDQPEEERENAVCHELLHCVLADVAHTSLALTDRMGARGCGVRSKRDHDRYRVCGGSLGERVGSHREA